MALEEFNHFFGEAKLTTEKRNDLDDSQFGIPEERKYPLYDKAHVISAVTYFGKAEDKYKPELARRIVKRAKELNIEWCQWFDEGKSMYGYLKYLSKADQKAFDNWKDSKSKPIKEATEPAASISDTPETRDILNTFSKAKISYDNAEASEWRLKSPDEVMDKQIGNCHDTSYYAYMQLSANHDAGMLFFIEYNSKSRLGGATHSICYEKLGRWIVGIELSWDCTMATIPANTTKELANIYKNIWDFGNGFDSLMCLEVNDLSGLHPGMTLSEYVDYMMKHSTVIFDEKVKSINESYISQDLTTGTSDFDEKDDDPEDCFIEADRSFFNQLTDKENMLTPMELKTYAKRFIRSADNNTMKKEMVFDLRDGYSHGTKDTPHDEKCYNFFMKLLYDIDKAIDKGMGWSGNPKWLFYERKTNQFFKAIGYTSRFHIVTGIDPHKGYISFLNEEVRKIHYNPKTDVLLHGGDKGYKYLKPSHKAGDNRWYPSPRIYFVLGKRSEYEKYLDATTYGDGGAKYEAIIDKPIDVFFDTETPQRIQDAADGKYGLDVFINTRVPIPCKPAIPPEEENINEQFSDEFYSEEDIC